MHVSEMRKKGRKGGKMEKGKKGGKDGKGEEGKREGSVENLLQYSCGNIGYFPENKAVYSHAQWYL